MEETNTNVLEEENTGTEIPDETDTSEMTNDDLKKAIDEQMSKLRRSSILIGAQTACNVILSKIHTHLGKPGKKSYRDYERLIKEIVDFCETGVSRKVNPDGTTSPIEESNEAVEEVAE